MAGLNAGALTRLRDVLQRHVDDGLIPGAVVVVSHAGHVQLFEALGQQDPRSGSPMRADSIFRIYSMTKPIVSLLALMLAEEGRLALGDPVARYLPEFARMQVAVEEGGAVRLVAAQRDMTLHDLLRHTAGLTYEFLGDNAVQRRYIEADINSRDRTNAAFVQTLAALPLQDDPGTCWQYSRATDVLGAVLEVVTGRTLGALLAERILEPLAMKDTSFAVAREHWHRIAQPFATDPQSGVPVDLPDVREAPAFESAGGGLVSTAHDYLRFLLMLRNGGTLSGVRLCSRKTIEWMTADHLGPIPPRGDLLLPGYGFGLGVAVRLHAGRAPQPGSPGKYYWSGIGGTSFFVDPTEDLVAMLLTQAPHQRFYFRNLLRHLVYAALD